MTLKSVLRNLQEVFPQIDIRILRAVAIEFSKDADAAVEFVLSDVLPIIGEPAETSDTRVSIDAGYWPSDNPASEYSSDQGANEGDRSSFDSEIDGQKEGLDQGANETNRLSYHDKGQKENLLTSDPNPRTAESEKNSVSEHRSDAHPESHFSHVILSGDHSNVLSDKSLELSQIYGAKCDVLDVNGQELCKTNVDGTLGVSLDSSPTLSFKPIEIYADPMICEAGTTKSLSSCTYLHDAESLVSFDDVAKYNSTLAAFTNAEGTPSAYTAFQVQCSEKSREHEKQSLVSLEDVAKYNTMLAAFTNAEGTPSAYAVSQVKCSEKSGEYVDSTCFQSGFEGQGRGHLTEIDVEKLSLENVSLSVSNDLQSGIAAAQEEDITKTDFLNGVILDLQNRKGILEAALESSIDMLKEVKLHEELAEQARKEASITGQDVQKTIDDLRQMIMHAEVTNAKTAEEINAEKSKLDSETQELGSQLVMLSDETENSLSVMEKVRETLVARLATAKEELVAAEKKKLNKEDMTHKFLIEQEGVVNSLVQETSRLHKEAEEKAKLRESLMDHRRSLNMLQGHVASLREAVLLLSDRVEGCAHHSLKSESSSMIGKEAKDPPSECHHHHNHHDYKEQSDDDWEILEAGKLD